MTEQKELSPEEITKLEAKLDKHIDNFANLFRMLDSTVDGERENALRFLSTRMKQINEITFQLTGKKGDLNFASLLDKIENSGGSEDGQVNAEELQEIIQINEDLKEAETLLIEEVERLKTLVKLQNYSNVDSYNLKLFFDKFRKMEPRFSEFSKQTKFMVDNNGAVGSSIYQDALDKELNKSLNQEGNLELSLSQKVIGKIIKKMGYEISLEDNMNQRNLLKAQQELLQNKSEELSEEIKSFGNILGTLPEILEVLRYKGGVDPDVLQDIFAQLNDAQNRVADALEIEAKYKSQSMEVVELHESIENMDAQNSKLFDVIEALDGATELKEYYQKYQGLSEEEAFAKACDVYANRSMATQNTAGHYQGLKTEFDNMLASCKPDRDLHEEKDNLIEQQKAKMADLAKKLKSTEGKYRYSEYEGNRQISVLENILANKERALTGLERIRREIGSDNASYKKSNRIACAVLVALTGYIGIDKISDHRIETDLTNKLNEANKEICLYQDSDSINYVDSHKWQKTKECYIIKSKM